MATLKDAVTVLGQLVTAVDAVQAYIGANFDPATVQTLVDGLTAQRDRLTALVPQAPAQP